ALRYACLLQVAAVGAQNRDLPGSQASGLRKSVEAVIVVLAAPDRQEQLLEKRSIVGKIDLARERICELHVVQEDAVVAIPGDLESPLADDAEAHALKKRHAS